VTLRLPARARKARAVRVRIGRARSHVVPVRAGRVRVDLRGVVKGTYVLRVTRGGRVLVHRAVRTCRGRA
jgi:hypothetical protein